MSHRGFAVISLEFPVVRGGKIDLALQLSLTPLILQLIERKSLPF